MTIDDLTPGMVVRLYGDRFPLGYVTATVIRVGAHRPGEHPIVVAQMESPEAPSVLIYAGAGTSALIWGTTHHITRMEEVSRGA